MHESGSDSGLAGQRSFEQESECLARFIIVSLFHLLDLPILQLLLTSKCFLPPKHTNSRAEVTRQVLDIKRLIRILVYIDLNQIYETPANVSS